MLCKRMADNKSTQGSATVEAAIVLPVFLIALFSLAYVIRIIFAFNAMQSALQNVARNISNASYFYHVTGLMEYSDRLDVMGDESQKELVRQGDTILDAVNCFNDSLLKMRDYGNEGGYGSFNRTIDSYNHVAADLYESVEEAEKLVNEILKDPESEGKLILSIFAQKVSYEVRKELVCMVAKNMLDKELNRRVYGTDVYKTLGIRKEQINFRQSQIFGDRESLEFIVHYTVNAPMPFSIIPRINLSNRVKIIAWTGGRGQAARVSSQENNESGEEYGNSIWVNMDTDQRYWDRGLYIEEKEMNKLKTQAAARGMSFMAADKKLPAADAFIYNNEEVEVYDIFTLNPFMKSYRNNKGRIKAEIKKHGKRLMEPDFKSYEGIPGGYMQRRIVMIVVPENSPDEILSGEFDSARKELMAAGIDDVILIKGYGGYTGPSAELEEAAVQ